MRLAGYPRHGAGCRKKLLAWEPGGNCRLSFFNGTLAVLHFDYPFYCGILNGIIIYAKELNRLTMYCQREYLMYLLSKSNAKST